MSEQHTQEMTSVFISVLENMAFLFAEEAEVNEVVSLVSPALMATVEFRGPYTGCVQAAAPHDFCRLLACNMLGYENDAELPEHAEEDALKELVNVAAGEFLEKLAGARALFSLSVPMLTELSSDSFRELAQKPGTAALMIDGAPCLCRAETSAG